MSVSVLGAQAVVSGTITSSRPASLVTGAANTKGLYTAQVTSTTYPAAWVMVDVPRALTATDFLIDIAVGAASSEQVVIANLPVSQNSATSLVAANWLFPLFIPAGSRVASRAQAVGASQTVDVQVTLFAPMLGSERGLGQSEACGAVTATSLGTGLDPGGVADTKGSWVPLITSTTFAYKWVCVSLNHTQAVAIHSFWAVDIGVGGSGSEVVVVPNLTMHAHTVIDANPAIGLCFPLSIPAGSRVSARCQSSSTGATERLMEIVLHGVG